MFAPRALRLGGRIKLLEEFIAQQFHAHRSHFTEFYRRAAIGVNVFRARGQSVERVPGFVQNRFHVALHADGIHKNEGQTGFGQVALVAAGRFALAILQIQQMFFAHESKIRRQS